MATDVVMPQMGESIFEGTITKWLKKPGENVQRDEPLFEISTDKVDAEIPAPASGVLREIKVGEGQTVQVNTIVGVIDANGASSGVSKSTPAPTPAVSSPEAGLESRASATPVRNASATRGTAATDGPSVQKTPPVAQKAPTPATPRAQEQGNGQPGERPSAIAQPQVSAQGGATAGAVEVKMPQMGESIFEGTITKWLKQPGDQVRRDEPLFEISTDKVDAEIPAPASGVLAEIRAQAGETVQVNGVVAVISAAGAVPAAQPTKPAQAAAAPTPQPTPPAPSASAVARDLGVQPQRTQIYPEARDAERVRSSPLVRRLAKEHGVDLTKVSGTGEGGRITKEDIENYIAQPAGPSVAGRRPSAEAPRSMAVPVTPLAQGALEIPGDLVPMTPMRRKIAERMVESKRTSPHVHTIYEVDMTRVASLRTKVRAAWEQRNGTKLTFMPFIARATCAALRKYPIVNSSVEGDAIRYHRSINLGIAVALDWGLIVPVIRNAEEKNFLGLARAINDLSERARTKRLNPDDVLNGTFTITNPGSIGGLIGLPIIMQPQVAILGTGGIKKQPVVVTDEDGADSISIRSIMHIVLGYDHRIIDGAIAGYFLGFLKKFLEEWAEEIG
jgi:2-oxoglutarate dehydrogenase E2 component (dihydrolipoamide succinyltransferase)